MEKKTVTMELMRINVSNFIHKNSFHIYETKVNIKWKYRMIQ